MLQRMLVLAILAAFTLCVVPAQAAKHAQSEEKMISAMYMKGADQVASRQWNAGIATLTKVIDNPVHRQHTGSDGLELFATPWSRHTPPENNRTTA